MIQFIDMCNLNTQEHHKSTDMHILHEYEQKEWLLKKSECMKTVIQDFGIFDFPNIFAKNFDIADISIFLIASRETFDVLAYI